jgi:NAD-dependent protein deacetylase/lipoamidase
MAGPKTVESPAFAKAQELLRNAESVAVLTGAGISAESGIPTFRGSAGLWKQFRPEDLATPGAFVRDPVLVWQWYDWRRALIAKAEPNAGHFALAQLARSVPQFILMTQNVDGLHQRAGSSSVRELHGSIWKLRCMKCGLERTDRSVPIDLPPRCLACGALARPGVVWFGEMLPAQVWREAEQATKSCDLFLVIGTSAAVFPAAGLVPLAKSSLAKIIEINLEPTAMSGLVDVLLQGHAGEILPRLIAG